MSSLLLTVLSLVIFTSQGGNSQTTTQQCGTVGHDLQTAQTRLTDLRFYLNTQNPAPCDGNVSTWEYCYYSPNIIATDEYQAPFGVYRLAGSTYQLVSEFLIDISSANIGSDSFTCRTFSTPVTAIQIGDVIGTCVHDVGIQNNFQTQINLVGGSASGYTLLSAGVSGRCSEGTQVSVPGSVSTSDLSVRTSTVLHLYANIIATTVGTTTPPPTTMDTTTAPPTTMETTTSPPNTLDTTIPPPTIVDTTTPPPTTVDTTTPPPTTAETTSTPHSRETTTTPQPPLTFDTRTATLSPTIEKTSSQPTLFETTTLLTLPPQQTAITATIIIAIILIGVALLVSISAAIVIILVVATRRHQNSNASFVRPNEDLDDETFQATYLEIVDSTGTRSNEALVDSVYTSPNEAYGRHGRDHSRSHNTTETSQMQVALDTTTQNVAYVPMPSSEGDNEYEYI